MVCTALEAQHGFMSARPELDGQASPVTAAQPGSMLATALRGRLPARCAIDVDALATHEAGWAPERRPA
jgi:hypothetical protein